MTWEKKWIEIVEIYQIEFLTVIAKHCNKSWSSDLKSEATVIFIRVKLNLKYEPFNFKSTTKQRKMSATRNPSLNSDGVNNGALI